jgi:hypothetical protein
LVGSQGVEPRVSRRTADLQSVAVASAARCPMVRMRGFEPLASTLATSRSSRAELHPRISERVRPSRLHVLRKFLTSSGLSPSTPQYTVARVGRASEPRSRRIQCALRRQGESPLSNYMLLNSIPRLSEQRGWRNTVWVVWPSLRGFLRWLGSRGCPVRLAPSGQRALQAVSYRVRSEVRDDNSQTDATSYP